MVKMKGLEVLIHPRKISKEEFEKGYAERCGMTVAQLALLGRVAEPCGCGENGCQGWQMVHEENRSGINPQVEIEVVKMTGGINAEEFKKTMEKLLYEGTPRDRVEMHASAFARAYGQPQPIVDPYHWALMLSVGVCLPCGSYLLALNVWPLLWELRKVKDAEGEVLWGVHVGPLELLLMRKEEDE